MFSTKKRKNTATIQFTHAELSAIQNVYEFAVNHGKKLEGPEQWAIDRIFREWKALADDQTTVAGQGKL